MQINSNPEAHYETPVNKIEVDASDDEIIARAIAITQKRLRKTSIVFDSSESAKQYLILTENKNSVEEFRAIWLDAQHQMIAIETLSIGTLTQASVYPREVVRSGLKHNAAAVIISHNHPSGKLTPSEPDKQITEHLAKALNMLGIKLLDHIITAGGRSLSFVEEGIRF